MKKTDIKEGVTDHRAALASARRLYLHWTQAKQPGASSRFEGDMSRIIASFEAACDALDGSADLRQRCADLEAALILCRDELRSIHMLHGDEAHALTMSVGLRAAAKLLEKAP